VPVKPSVLAGAVDEFAETAVLLVFVQEGQFVLVEGLEEVIPTDRLEGAFARVAPIIDPLIEDTFEDTLVISGQGRGELPRIRTTGHHPSDVGPTLAAVRAQLGLDAIVLACRSLTVADGIVHRVLELELPNDPHATADLTGADPVDGRDWTIPGWWTRATDWLTEQVRATSLGPVRAIEQIRTWEFSCVLRVHTDRSELYFKALPHSYAHEPRLAQHLAEHHPDFVPQVLATDERERWLLMRACRGRALESGAPLSAWERAAAGYAQLQVASLAHVPRLAALGCRQRGPLELRTDLALLLEDEPALLGHGHHGLSAEELRLLRQLRPALEAACDELATGELPISLEHGDLWSSNVYVGDDHAEFIDWTDASLAHPFFSLMPFLQSVAWDPHVSTNPAAPARMTDRYLELWRPYAETERLRRALAIAQPLAALHIAVTYWRDIPQPHLQWWIPRMVPFFARLALEQWDHVTTSR
jgi:hypothetical protein